MKRMTIWPGEYFVASGDAHNARENEYFPRQHLAARLPQIQDLPVDPSIPISGDDASQSAQSRPKMSANTSSRPPAAMYSTLLVI